MSVQLFQHNATAYEAVLHLFETTGRAAVIHPTGTGKSFIGFKLCEQFPASRVLWLSPSEYIFETQLQNLAEAADGYRPQNITFCTYARLMRMEEAEMRLFRPDYIVMDEFHRCGAEKWGGGVQRLLALYPAVPLLGLSATAVRYLDNRRDMADELFGGSVASEMTLGEAIVRGILTPPRYVTTVYSFQKEYERARERVNRLQSGARRDRAEVYLEQLRRALEQADGLDRIFEKHMLDRHGKYLVFCADHLHMRGMMQKAGEWFARVDDAPRIYSVYSLDPATAEAFAAFKADQTADHLRLLYCIDALNEGIHVEGVSGVILLRPTVSPIIYKQQIGRALSASSKSDAVIFDVVMNIDNLYSIDSVKEEMEAAKTYYRSLGESRRVVNERFEVIDEVQNCRALFEKLDDTLEASWDVMYACAKRFFEAQGHLDVPVRFKTEEGYSLGVWIANQRKRRQGLQSGSLRPEQIEKLNAIGMIWDDAAERSWKKYYEAAAAYAREQGDLLVPAHYVTREGVALGAWIARIRMFRRLGEDSLYLQPERVAALNACGMVWEPHDCFTERCLAAAGRYYKAHGDLNVAVDYVDDEGVRLGVWLSNLRARGRENAARRLTGEQLSALLSYGMRWENQFDQNWQRGYDAALRYYGEHGNLHAPPKFVDAAGYRLGAWLRTQRLLHRRGALAPERAEKLEQLGFLWQSSVWYRNYETARRYYEANGSLEVPPHTKVGGIYLDQWIAAQRRAYRAAEESRRLSAEQIRLLESIGMRWCSAKEAAWQARYNAFFDYFTSHDTPPAADRLLADGKPAGRWLETQQKKQREGRLTERQEAALQRLCPRPATEPWAEGYRHAQDYARQNGALFPPTGYRSPDGYELGKWVARQRQQYKAGALTDRQTEQLKALGMVWSPKEQAWETMYRQAADYYAAHQNLDVPASETRLHRWIWTQRTACREGRLTEEQKNWLNAIGMRWQAKFPRKDRWQLAYEHAAAYRQEHGHLKVPDRYVCPDGFKLGAWIFQQRKRLKEAPTGGGLTPEQAEKLRELGLTLYPAEEQWEEMYAAAERYYREHHHLNIAVSGKFEGRCLGRWLKAQRGRFANGRLTEAQIGQLNAIGMNWQTTSPPLRQNAV